MIGQRGKTLISRELCSTRASAPRTSRIWAEPFPSTCTASQNETISHASDAQTEAPCGRYAVDVSQNNLNVGGRFKFDQKFLNATDFQHTDVGG